MQCQVVRFSDRPQRLQFASLLRVFGHQRHKFVELPLHLRQIDGHRSEVGNALLHGDKAGQKAAPQRLVLPTVLLSIGQLSFAGEQGCFKVGPLPLQGVGAVSDLIRIRERGLRVVKEEDS